MGTPPPGQSIIIAPIPEPRRAPLRSARALPEGPEPWKTGCQTAARTGNADSTGGRRIWPATHTTKEAEEDGPSKTLDHDFRVGGRRRLAFGPPDGTPYLEDCRYEDIVPGRRICYAMTISQGDVRITTSMVTVETNPRANRTELIVTDQTAILDGGDTAKDRERGWGETLDKLPAVLSASRAGP